MNKIKNLYRFLAPKFQSLFLDYPVDFKPRYGHGKPPHAALYDIINKNRASYQELLQDALQHAAAFQKIPLTQNDTQQPFWKNGFLPGLDIVMLYTLLVKLQPKRYVEIGSGNSTKVAYKAKTEHQLLTEIISIDPMPRAEIDQLADRVIRKPFEETDFNFLHNLEANDILFVDNSHRILPNSDAMVFFLEVLPRLQPGVIVHIHDVYLPYDYPQFMCDRFYSEQYGLAMYLLANADQYQPFMPNYFVSEDLELSNILAPLWKNPNLQGVEQHGGSFWLKIGG